MSPSIFEGAGPDAREIAHLGGWVTLVLTVVGAIVVALIVTSAFRLRGSLDTHAPYNHRGDTRWIIAGGFAVPIVVLAIVFAATIRSLGSAPLHDSEHGRPDIRIVARQWWWQVDYISDSPSRQITTANEIHIPTNWPVEIEVESRDVIHSFWVPALHGKIDVIPGRQNRIRLHADKPGRYEGQCAELCGVEHALMRFEVVVEPMDAYEGWLAAQAAPAAAPVDPESARGMALFESKACGLCHRIRGTQALAGVGPDLTHIASRRGIAAFAYPNTRAYLEAWIVHAQSLKSGSEMPDLAQLRGDELQSIAHYLETLQ